MPRFVELQYNPYIPQIQILVDGVPPPEFSRLIQYSDEDIWIWITEIMDTLYLEIRDEFFLSFTGTKQDAEIVQFVCEKNEYCTGFRYKEFPIFDGLTKRMGKLNQLIKKTGTTLYKKSVIDALFFVGTSFQDSLKDICSLDINNCFCSVRVSTMDERFQYDDGDKSVLFLLVDSIEDGKRQLQYTNMNKPAFVLTIGDERKILDITESGWFIQTTQNMLFETIFDCFLQIPLLIIFRKCVKSIKGGNKVSKELRLITCVQPLVNITVGKEVEVGKSIRISADLKPEVGDVPKLVFQIRNSQVASCDGLAVYGIKEGICTLEVFKSGSKQPFFTKEIRVYKRNRITKLLLSEDSMILGVNDTKHLNLDYYPTDADNINTITWKSSDENVATIDIHGNITTAGIGSCRLICTAENVSAQCMCTVKPYLSDIEMDLQLDENDMLSMMPLQEITIFINCIPKDCIDGIVTLESSDTNVVNVVKNTLYAKNIGTATITIKNNTSRICRSFMVNVAKRKKGFFRLLFK